jgi:hypothetical protein
MMLLNLYNDYPTREINYDENTLTNNISWVGRSSGTLDISDIGRIMRQHAPSFPGLLVKHQDTGSINRYILTRRELNSTGTVTVENDDNNQSLTSLQSISPYWDERVRNGIARINEAAGEASEPGWDGYCALPINDYSRRLAYKFIKRIPESIPLPEVVVDPDGEVSFDWYNERKESFAVSISSDGLLSFAGLFQRGNVYGSELLLDEVPKPILTYIERLFN